MSSLLSQVLVTLFGSSTWLNVNAVWMQLPLLVNELPEQWKLPSYLALIVQFGGFFALIYGFLAKYISSKCKGNSSSGCSQRVLIVALLLSATVLTVGLSFTYQFTTVVLSHDHSYALFIIFFALSAYCSMTNMVFLPHLAAFEASLITQFFVGMGLSALVPSITALVQGVGRVECLTLNTTNELTNQTSTQTFPVAQPALFGVDLFMLIMAGWLLLATVAYLAMLHLGASNMQSATQSVDHTTPNISTESALEKFNVEVVDIQNEEIEKSANSLSMGHSQFVGLLFMTGWVCALMNSIIPSIQIYSCLPYGQTTYHLALTLSNIANPIACLVPMKLKSTVNMVTAVTVFVSMVCGYIIGMALMSPAPLWMHHSMGGILAIVSNVSAIALLAYVRTVTAGFLREATGDSETRLFWCGAATQIGSLMGAVVIFPAVNVWHLFEMADQCSS